MSPQMDSVLGWWLQLVGGRQSARTIHFIVMSLFVLFTLVHVLMVVYAGPINEMRSMITGRFRVRYPRDDGEQRMTDSPGMPVSPRRGGACCAPPLPAPAPACLPAAIALSNSERFVDVLGAAEPLSQRVQRALTGNRLAAEFPESMISPVFRPNGSIDPQTPEYLALKADGFRGYRLQVAAWSSAARILARRAARAADAHPDHAPRLRRRLERDRQVERRAAGAPARPGAAEARRALRRVPLLRRPQPATARAITRASTCSTPTTRRRSSPTASTARRCRSPTARRCGCGSSASSATSSPSTCG